MSIERELGGIHTKLENIETLIKAQNGRVGKLEDKVSAMQQWQAWVIGACTAVGAGITATIMKIVGGIT